MNYRELLITKIKDRTALVGVFGLGYVGLPLATLLGDHFFKVIGFETDKNKIKVINDGRSYLNQIQHRCVGSSCTKR